MFFLTTYILCFSFFNIVEQIPCLEFPAKEDKEIVGTDWTLPNIVHNLLSTLKFDVKPKQKLKQYLIIHNFFVSVTLQDHVNLKKIAKITKVDNKIDNNTQIFITHLNELFNKDNKSDEATDDVYVTMFIKAFHKNLEDLKEVYGLNRNISNFSINKEVLRHISNNEHDFDEGGKFKNSNLSNNNDTNDAEFWDPSGRRIYSGKRVKIKRFPFMASVQFFKKFQCGGSIIKSDLVITSSSCLQLAWNNRFFRENPAFLSVQVGSDVYQYGDENIPILEINFHPNYNPKTLKHNIALMRLMRQLKFGKENKRVKKIDFDRNPWPLPDNSDGITIVGWGARSFQNVMQNPLKNPLSMAVLDYYPFKECQDVYSKEYVTERNFCAGFFSKGGGACNHDAGGPGIAHGILMGVISFGSPVCGAPDAPTVFTKLGYYTDWIEEIMEMPVVYSKTLTTLRQPKDTEFHVPYAHISTTTFKTKPVSNLDRNPKRDDSNFEITLPLNQTNTNALRIINLDRDRFFQEFLTTMFNSKEIEEYIDQMQAELDEESTEVTTQSKLEIESKPKTKIKSKTKTTLKSKSKLKSTSKAKLKHKATTKSKNTIKIKAKIELKTKTRGKNETTAGRVGGQKKLHKKHEVVKKHSSSDENIKLERVLTDIFDNLKIPDFFESHLSSGEGTSMSFKDGTEKKISKDQHENKGSIESESNLPFTKGTYTTILHADENNKEEEESNENNTDLRANTENKGNIKSDENKNSEDNDNENNYESESNENNTDLRAYSENKEKIKSDENSEGNYKENNYESESSENNTDLRPSGENKEKIKSDKNENSEGNENENNYESESISNYENIDDSENYETDDSTDIENNEEINSYESDTDDYEGLNIATNSVRYSTSKNDDTEKVLNILTDVDDIQGLVNQAIGNRRNNKDQIIK